MTDTLERHKQDAMAFYDMMFNQCKPAEAIERYVGDRYTQHNPHMADGKQAFMLGSTGFLGWSSCAVLEWFSAIDAVLRRTSRSS